MNARSIATISGLSIGLLVAGSVLAKPDAKVSVTKGNGGATVSIPAHAAELAPDIYSLGTADIDGVKAEGIMIVHRSNAKVSPAKPGGSSTCYSYLASGAKWKTPENWLINPANNFGLTGIFLRDTTAAAIGEWEAAANGVNIMGNGTLTGATLSADESAPDGKNEIYFGSIADPGVIAVTITWGYFGGNPNTRQLFEMDQIYDQADFSWSGSAIANPLAMDYENIAQHELGHGLGMGHAPNTAACNQETMFPYAQNGETLKRDLGPGDIAGIKGLY